METEAAAPSPQPGGGNADAATRLLRQVAGMRQLDLIPAGCQPWNNHVTASSGRRFAYCSTLAVYVYDIESYQLLTVLAAHTKAITSLSWSPLDAASFATSSLDGTIAVWNVETERRVKEHRLPQGHPMCLEYSMHSSSTLAYASNTGQVCTFDTVAERTHVIREPRSASEPAIRVLRWAPRKPGILAVGNINGTLTLLDSRLRGSKAKVAEFKPPNRETLGPIVDMRWDPLSDNYLLIAYKRGCITLYDSDQCKAVHTFDVQSGGNKNLSWLPHIPGCFASTNRQTGALRLWNVSSMSPTEIVRVHHSGFHSFTVMRNDPNRVLCTFQDGTVGIFNLRTRQFDFCTEGGHTETIFGCDFSPANPDILASGSYDGHIKIWDTSTMTCVTSLSAGNHVVYSVSWNPSGTQLAVGTSDGSVYIWDVARGQMTHTLRHHKASVYRAVWSNGTPEFIASCSRDNTVIVCNPDGVIKKRYRLPRATFGCEWDVFTPQRLCVGCHDGSVRVFDAHLPGDAPVHTLKGHTSRVFNTAWNPVVPNVLASGSDDRTVRVWRVPLTGDTDVASIVLRGHTDNVRALCWSRCIPWMLLSGSWDGTIRVWDVRSGDCLNVVYDHHGDVYSIACHASRPFLFVSTSRDTTMRVWTMEDGVASLKLACLNAPVGTDLRSTVYDAKATSMVDSNAPLALSGEAALRMLLELHECTTEAQWMHRIYEYFSCPNGIRDLLDLSDLGAERVDTTPTASMRIISKRSIKQVYQGRAAEHSKVLASAFGGGIGSMRKSERVRQAVALRCQLGQFDKACELLISQGSWLEALAIAPAASPAYWKSVLERYNQHLLADSPEKAVPYLLAAGDIESVITVYQERGRHQDALLISTLAEDGSLRGQDAHAATGPAASSTTASPDSPVAPRGSTAAGASERARWSERSRQVALRMSQEYLQRGQPILAAAVMLSVQDVQSAVHVLFKGNELDLAVSLCRLGGVKNEDYVLLAAALRAERLGLPDSAIALLQRTRDPSRQVALLCARLYPVPSAEQSAMYRRHGIRSPDSYLTSAKAADGGSAGVDPFAAVFSYIMASQHNDAVRVGVEYLRCQLALPAWDAGDLDHMLSLLASVDHTQISDVSSRKFIVASALYLGMMRGIWRRYPAQMLWVMLSRAEHLISANDLMFPVPVWIMKLQLATHTASVGDVTLTQRLIDELGTPGGGIPVAADTCLARLRLLVRRRISMASSSSPGLTKIASNAVVPTGSKLPASSASRHPSISTITDRQIVGPALLLEDGHTCLSLADACMWHKVNLYSPLCTGARLMPY